MQGAYYHILSRGNEGREIFYGDEDKGLFLETVGEMSDRLDIDIFAFRNEEVGKLFRVSYSVVSHIVRRVTRQLQEDKNWQRKRKSRNSKNKI